ncbi:MAG TPA: hypothetical protein VLN74_12675, partial [Ilumatobacteraceae bacterium]|nr:hypothetical protein [Ilumatobacteraceae bacterium]
QRCEVGEIRWIGIPAEPGDALDEPAPAMELVGPVASAPTTEPTEPAATDPAATDAAATDPVVTVAPTGPEVAETSPETDAVPGNSEPVLISTGGDETGDSGTGTLVFIVSIAAVLGIGGFVVYRSRQARAGIASDAR